MSDRNSLEIKQRISLSDPDNLGYLEFNHPMAVLQTKLVLDLLTMRQNGDTL